MEFNPGSRINNFQGIFQARLQPTPEGVFRYVIKIDKEKRLVHAKAEYQEGFVYGERVKLAVQSYDETTGALNIYRLEPR